MRRAVFLDRDGVINRNIFNGITGEFESPGVPEDFELHANVLPAIRKLQDADFLLFLVSNQPNYAKGKNTLQELEGVHARLVEALHTAGIRFTNFYYCFHHPNGVVASHSGPCKCRKPSPFFLTSARDEFGVDLAHSWLVGDRGSDIECGLTAGVRTIRVREDHPAKRSEMDPVPDYEAGDLASAVDLILAHSYSNLEH